MATVVVKLGSSIVADDAGELRIDVLGGLLDEVAARHTAGDEVVIVTSGAIAAGMRLMALPMRPTAMEELQAASAVGQGKLYRVYDELLQERGVPSAQAILIGADRLVLLTDTGGLYSADPRRDPDASLVERVAGVEELEGYDIGLSS